MRSIRAITTSFITQLIKTKHPDIIPYAAGDCWYSGKTILPSQNSSQTRWSAHCDKENIQTAGDGWVRRNVLKIALIKAYGRMAVRDRYADIKARWTPSRRPSSTAGQHGINDRNSPATVQIAPHPRFEPIPELVDVLNKKFAGTDNVTVHGWRWRGSKDSQLQYREVSELIIGAQSFRLNKGYTAKRWTSAKWWKCPGPARRDDERQPRDRPAQAGSAGL